jgi:hypothetical protein
MGQYYYPQEPKEPSGCMETLLITRIIFSLLAVPVAIIAGGVAIVIGALYLYTISPFLGLIPVAIIALGLYLGARWEHSRAERQRPPGD